jgi:hypothetical protein
LLVLDEYSVTCLPILLYSISLITNWAEQQAASAAKDTKNRLTYLRVYRSIHMAVLEEPAAKRRRLNATEAEDYAAFDSLIHDLMAVSPWEIVTVGLSLYHRLEVATSSALLQSPPTGAIQRLYNMLLQHLEICLQWTATDMDECDDQELYVHAVTSIVRCVKHIYAPELDDRSDDDTDDDETPSSSISLLFRTLGFLLQHDDSSSNSVEGMLQIVRIQLVSKGTSWGALSAIQQRDAVMILVRVASKTAISMLTMLRQYDEFAKIAFETMIPDNTSIHPQTRTESLFSWQCQLAHAGIRSESLQDCTLIANTLRIVILETQRRHDHHSLLDRMLALDCLVGLTQHQQQLDRDCECCLRQLVLHLLSNQQQRLVTATCAVTALQNLLADQTDETIFDYFDAMDDPPTFLSVLLQVSQSSCEKNLNAEARFLETANHCQNVSVWALELFWTFVSVAVRRLSDNTSMNTVAELALSSIDDCCRCDEYKLYLAARTICLDHPAFFQTQSKNSHLVTSLSIVLRDPQSSAVSKHAVISFFQTIVQDSDELSLMICQDRDVLDVIARLGAVGESDEAPKLLFALSDYVPNRMRLIRRPRVLFAMMRFAQQQQQQDDRSYHRRVWQLTKLL